MANPVDVVIGSEAIKQVQNLVAQLTVADSELVKISQSALLASKSIAGISPKSFNDSVNNNVKLNAELERQTNIIKSLSSQVERLTSAKNNYNQKTATETVNQQILNRNAIAEAKSVSNMVGQYQKLDLAHKKALMSAQNIGVQYGTTSVKFKRAATEANKLDKELKKIDASLGKSQRNVGNYSSAFNSLGSSLGIVGGITGAVMLGKEIFSVTAELQSLDNALKLVTKTSGNYIDQQTFLTRISEAYGVEIGSLTKQFTQFYVSAQDKISGNQIQGIFESITKAGASMGLSVETQERAFLALNQMMSKGTIQAEELRGQLGEALPGAFGIMAKSMGVTEKQLGKMMKDGEVLASEVLPKFAKQLEKTYGIENLTRVENLTSAQSRLSNAWKDFVRSLDEDGNKMSKLFSSLLNEITETITAWRGLMTTTATATKNELSKIRAESKKETIDYYETVKNLDLDEIKNKKLKYQEEARGIRRNFDNLANINKQIEKTGVRSPFGQLAQEDVAKIEANKKQMALLNQSMSVYYGNIEGLNTVLNPNKKIEAEIVETKKYKVKAQKLESIGNLSLIKEQDTALGRLQMLKKALETTRDETSKNSTEFEQFNKSIEDVNKAIEVITKPLSADVNIKKPFQEAKEEVKELNQYLKSFIDEFASNSGFGETFKMLGKDIEGFGEDFGTTFNAIAESAQEMFNFISNASQQNFDAEYSRLQSQKEIALMFAGDSASAKAKIEEDAEKKRKEIANRENKAKQKQAIFNIAIDTAQGIISALASTPPNVPLSIAIGVLGAAQIGIVAAQKIPQYWEGTDNHSGGLMIVNDAKGSSFQEKVIFPNGKEFMPQGRNVIMDAPAGTKVLTPEQQLMSALNGTNINLSKETINRSNNMTPEQMDYILGKHFSKIQTNTTNIDKRGITQWSERNGNRTIQNNNRVSRTGFSV